MVVKTVGALVAELRKFPAGMPIVAQWEGIWRGVSLEPEAEVMVLEVEYTYLDPSWGVAWKAATRKE